MVEGVGKISVDKQMILSVLSWCPTSSVAPFRFPPFLIHSALTLDDVDRDSAN